MGFTIHIEEKSAQQLGQLLKYMDRETDTKLGTKLAKLIVEAAQEMATEAKRPPACPVKYGRLRASIHAKTTASESFPYTDDRGLLFNGALMSQVEPGKSAVIGTNVDYALFQEIKRQFMYGAKVKIAPYLKQNLQKLAKEIIKGK